MNTIGLPIPTKQNEKRRALLPKDLINTKNKKFIFIEKGYGEILGVPDSVYRDAGVNIVSKREALKSDIVCDPKIGDAQYLSKLKNQTIFGWIHAVQNKEITDVLINNQLTAIAWEDMFEGPRHVFWRNNEIAGEAAILHAYLEYGEFPRNTNVAVIGRGNVAKGAIKVLTGLGAQVVIYDKKTEKLLREEIGSYDVIVNAILWDTKRKDHIIYKNDLARMKRGAMIIDISCDKSGGIESSVPTSINAPIYSVHGIVHYAVDHTPSLFYKDTSSQLSMIVSRYLDFLIEGKYPKEIRNAIVVKEGEIIDGKIKKHQNR